MHKDKLIRCKDRQTKTDRQIPHTSTLNPLQSNSTLSLVSWLYFSSSHTLTCLQASDLCERAGGPGKIRIWLIPQHYCAATGNKGTSALLHWLRTTVDNWLIYHREWGRVQRMMGMGGGMCGKWERELGRIKFIPLLEFITLELPHCKSHPRRRISENWQIYRCAFRWDSLRLFIYFPSRLNELASIMRCGEDIAPLCKIVGEVGENSMTAQNIVRFIG